MFAGNNLEDEVYWCVKTEILKWERLACPNALANRSIASDKHLVEEVHAYTMHKLAQGHRTGDVHWSQPNKLERQVQCIVQSWCMKQFGVSNCEGPCGVTSKKADPLPSKLMTSRQVFDKVIDDVISQGVPKLPCAVGAKSPNPGTSKQGLTTRQIQKLVYDQIISEAVGDDAQEQRSDFRWSKKTPSESASRLPNTTATTLEKPAREHWTAKIRRHISHCIAGPEPAKISPHGASE